MADRKRTYFLSDAHLGATYIADPRAHEARVTAMLEAMGRDAKAIYLMGDMIDFWFEYRTVVPRGYVRFFAALARLTDSGVKVYWFKGNHDMWTTDYLEKELGVEVVDESAVHEIDGKKFFLSHGDGLGKLPAGFRFIRKIFRNEFARRVGAMIHPRWMMAFAHGWSAHNRLKRTPEVDRWQGDDREPQMVFAREYAKEHGDIDFFVTGHRHVSVDRPVEGSKARFICLGECFQKFSYGVFDGERFEQIDSAKNELNKI